MWDQVVAAAHFELFKQVGGPVGAVDFQTIAEVGLDEARSGLEHGRDDSVQVLLGGVLSVVIDDQTFRAVGRALDLHVGGAGDVEVESRLALERSALQVLSDIVIGTEGGEDRFSGTEVGKSV